MNPQQHLGCPVPCKNFTLTFERDEGRAGLPSSRKHEGEDYQAAMYQVKLILFTKIDSFLQKIVAVDYV